MTHPSKVKGNNFERELVKQAIAAGLSAERAYASNGRALGEAETVDLLIDGVRVQAKRRKKIAHYLHVPDGANASLFREDRGISYIMFRWEDWLEGRKHAR